MAAIRIGDKGIGGIIPSTDPIALPASAAQIAHNADLSGGTIKPWSVINEFTALHDENGDMNPGFPSTDIDIITQADKVTLDKAIRQCQPWWKTVVGTPTLVYGWIEIDAWYFFEYVDPDTGLNVSDSVQADAYPTAIDNTPTGFVLHYKYLDSVTYTYKPGVVYRVYGPIHQFRFLESPDILFTGPPDQDYTYPATPTSGGDQIPDVGIPLIYPKDMTAYIDGDREDNEGSWTPTGGITDVYQYGTLRCTDYNGPQKSGRFQLPDSVTADVTQTDVASGTGAQFVFNCGFASAGRPTSKRVYYTQQMIDAEDRDGPESDVSDEIVIEPGQVVKLLTPFQAGYTKNRLYRSANAGSGFLKLDDVDEEYFWDDLRQALIDDLPPNGNVPHASVAEAVKGAVKHPAGYVVYYFGADLRPSSEWIELERPWAVPEEYAYTFDSTIQCITIIESTVLVFTVAAVYRVVGQHPARLSVYQISDKPILDKLSLWRTGNMAGWVTEEGMVVYSGGVPRLITGEYYRAPEWQDLDPTNFSAFTNDKTICLFQGTGATETNLRFDLRGAKTAALSTFDDFSGNNDWTWRSKLYQYPKPISWYAARIVADDYPIIMRLRADGQQVAEVSIAGGAEIVLPRLPKARRWEIELLGKEEFRRADIGTSIAEV